jgi:L-threonylcarbamoyladenylate synthase
MFISKCSTETISSAAEVLKDGGLVAFPTETVYGLGADAQNPEAVKRIYEVKGRPQDHPLIVHISEISDLEIWAKEIPDYAIKLARDFWPGPMTIILKRSEIAKDFITGNQETIGLRIPAQPIALALINEYKKLGGKGIAAPSANRFGKVSPTTAEAVAEELLPYLNHFLDRILDGGPSHIGIESTIINCTGESPEILRLGFITKEMIEESTGKKVENGASNIRVSGSLESHYAPNAKVLLNQTPEPGDGFIALSKVTTPDGCIRLTSPNTIEEYARDLYSALRLADLKGIQKIVSITPEGQGLPEAISDRLQRAATS